MPGPWEEILPPHPDMSPEEQQREARQSGLSSLGSLFLLGAFGVAGWRAVPPQMRARAALKIEELLEQGLSKAPWMHRMLPALADDVRDPNLFANSPALRAATTPERRMRGLHLQTDVDMLLKEIKSGGAMVGGTFQDMLYSFLDRYAVWNAKSFVGTIPAIGRRSYGTGWPIRPGKPGGSIEGSDWQHMSFEHLRKMSSLGRAALQRIPNAAVGDYQDVIRTADKFAELSAMPVIKDMASRFAKARGIEVQKGESVFDLFQVDPHLFVNRSAAQLANDVLKGGVQIRSGRRFSAENLAESVMNTRIPGVNWQPFRLMFPESLVKSHPAISYVNKKYTAGLAQQHGLGELSGGYIAGGKFFGIKDGLTLPGVGQNIRPLDVRSPAGRGFLANQDLLNYGGPTLRETLRSARGAQIPLQNAPGFVQNAVQWSLDRLTKLGHKLGVGPQFRAHPESRGMLGDWFSNTWRASKGPAQVTDLGKLGAEPSATWLDRRLGRAAKPLPTSTADLTWMEKAKLAIGIEPKRWVLRETDSGVQVRQKLEVARYGKSDPRPIPDYYSERSGTAPATAGQVFGHHATQSMNRVSWLAEQFGFGIGMRQSKTFAQATAQWLGVAGAVYAGTEAVRYADYKIDQVVGTSPFEIAGAGLVYSHYGMLQAQEELGVTAAVKEAEELFPGIESSSGSKLIRGVGSLLGGVAIGRATGRSRAGFFAGLGVGLWQATTDFTKPAQVFKEEIEGERRVPIKRGRGWTMGRQSYEGEGTLAYVPHWYQRMKGAGTETSIYGSEEEAWRGSWLPTPENLFLAKNIFDPYYLERKHHHSRPYPSSAPLFQEVPLVGPMMAATVGRFIKPEVRMHAEALQYSTDVPNSLGPEQDDFLGYHHPAQEYPVNVQTRMRLEAMTADTLYNLKEFSGLPGFMYEVLATEMLGMQIQKQPHFADAGAIASTSRMFYDRNLGGILGYSEVIRRFIPPENKWDAINPIPNLLAPDWLPGKNSVFSRDRKSITDFSTGDPYAKIDYGEIRLPGVGYESLHELHSGTPGAYSPVDRFSILADVSPSSAAFRVYRDMVGRWVDKGLLGEKWVNRFYEGLDVAKERLEQMPDGSERRFTRQNFFQTNLQISRVTSPTTFEAGGKAYKLAGIEADIKRLMYQQGATSADPESLKNQLLALQQELQSMIGQTIQASVGMRNGQFFPVAIDGLNQRYAEGGLWDGSKSAIATYARHGSRPDAAMWESVQHMELPGPLGWPGNKLFSRYDAVEQYKRQQIEGGDFAGWQQPIRNFIKPWTHQVYTGLTGDISPSAELQSKRNVESYFDRLKYYKHRSLTHQAQAAGGGHLSGAEAMEQMWRRTAIGMRAPAANWMADAYSAMPARDKKYFRRFTELQDKTDRERVLRMVPEDVKPIYMGVWDSLDPSTSTVGINATFSQMGALRNTLSMHEADSRVARDLSFHSVPGSSWEGWIPSVDIEDTKLATIESAGQDLHDYGMWQNQLSKIKMGRPWMMNQTVPQAYNRGAFDQGLYNRLMAKMGGQPNGMPYSNLRLRKRQNYQEDLRRQSRIRDGRF